MPRQEIIEIFRNHGINITAEDTSGKLVGELKTQTPDSLWPLVEDFSNGKPIGLNGCNELMHSLTLQYALVEAFSNDRDSITQADIDTAQERAAKLAESMSRGSSTRDDAAVEPIYDDEGEEVAAPVKRKRDPGLYPMILSLVEENMKATPDEILTMVRKSKPNVNESTVKVYYSKARSELNLPKIGKRGRKGSGIYGKIKTLIEANPDAERAEMIERILAEVTKPDGSPVPVGTAQAYYSKVMNS